MTAPFDLLLRNVRVAACADDACAVSPLGFVAIRQGRIARVGTMDELTARMPTRTERDGGGALLTPGLIDCTPISSTPATARANSSCGCKARATKRSAAPAAASAPPCARRAPPTRPRCSRNRHAGCKA